MAARENSRIARARRIYLDMLTSNPNVDRMEVVQKFVTDIPMKANSALTYWYMCQHSVTLPEVAPVQVPVYVQQDIVHTSPIVERPVETVTPVVEIAASNAVSAEEKLAAKRARDAARKREKRAQVRMMKQNASDLVEYVDVASL